MDPFSALSLATSVVQFIDFGTKLISGSYEIYNSLDGLTKEDGELNSRAVLLGKITSRIAGDRLQTETPSLAAGNAGSLRKVAESSELDAGTVQPHLPHGSGDENPAGWNHKVGVDEVVQKLQNLTPDLRLSSESSTLNGIQSTENEKAIHDIALSCNSISKNLQEALQKLQISPRDAKLRKVLSFRQAFKKICGQKKLDAMEKSLEKHRSDLTFFLVATLSDQQSRVARELRVLRDNSRRLGSAYESHLEDIFESLKLIQTQAAANTRHIESTTGRRIEQLDAENNHTHEVMDLAKTLNTLISSTTDVSVAQKVLHRLRYNTMVMRRENVADAHANTFGWIFKSPTEREAHGLNVHFHEWLTKGDGFYWISGKPGSGKSTLMKFLCDHEQTGKALSEWAQPFEPIISTHFFWSSGTTMQKSQEGLLRSLLYAAFKKSPKVIASVCPELWEAAKGYGAEAEPWTLSELRNALTSLAAYRDIGCKFCFFIDGLDEYDGDYHDIIKILQSLARSPNIKLCVSSRPWNVFEDAFGKLAERKLYLQDLTHNDIRLYVRQNLEEHPNWKAIPSEKGLYHNVVQDVTTRAQGVFLWVYLVVRSLKDGLTNGDSLSILERRMSELPADLEEFFKHMLDSVDIFYRTLMVRSFQVAMCSPYPLPLMIFHFLDQDFEDPDFSLRTPIMPMSIAEIDPCVKRIRRQLNGRCKGLLEVNKVNYGNEYLQNQVSFLHRTVRDFLCTKEMSKFLAMEGQSCGPNTLLFKSFVALIKSTPLEFINRSEDRMFNVMVESAMHFAYRAELESGLPQIALLDDFESTLQSYSQQIDRSGQEFPHPESCSLSDSYREDEASYSNGHSVSVSRQNFLEYSAKSGLSLYVKERLNRLVGPNVVETRNRLLHCTLGHPTFFTIEEPDLTETIRVILDHEGSSSLATIQQDTWLRFIALYRELMLVNIDIHDIMGHIRNRCGIIELLVARNIDLSTGEASQPAWYGILMGITSHNLPPSTSAAMYQTIKSLFLADPRLSGSDWSYWQAAEAVLRSFSWVPLNEANMRLEFVTKIYCLLISKGGLELTEIERSMMMVKFPHRLSGMILDAMSEQAKGKERDTQMVQQSAERNVTLSSWLLPSWLKW